MPQYMPAPQPYSQPARVPTPKPSPEHKELEEMKRLLGLMEERQKAEEEQKKQEAREQEIRNDAEKELIARTMEMKRVKEEAIREIEQVKLEVERKAREGLEAEDQRRRLEQEERERCDRIAREKVEAEFRIKDENERRIEEERVRRMKEMEEKVAQELEERRKLQEERDEELARFRQQIRDEVRAEFLRERQYLSSSLGAGGSSLCSSSPESLSSTSTISATRSLSLRSPEQISPKGSGSPPAFVTPAGEIQVMGVQVPDDRPPLAVLDTDLPKSSVVDPFVYLQDRSRPSTPAAEENDEIEQTSKGKGQHPRYSRSQPQASRSRDRRYANEDLKADFTHRGPPRSPCHSYGSESELMNMSTSKISDDEWSDVSELGAAPDSNQDSDHVIEPGSAYTGEDASAQMHGQSGLTPNTSISSIDFRKGRVQVDQGSENDMKSRFRAPEDDTDNLEKRKHAVSPFSVFQFLITEESSEESEGDDEGRQDDADSDDGGAALTNQHMPQMANDILAKDGAGEQLDRDQDCLVARIDPVQRSPSRDSPLLLLLKKHISDFEATSRRKNFTHTRSQAQDLTQEDGSSNASSSYSGDSDPMWDHPDRLKPYLVFPYCMGGRINRSGDSFRFKKPTEDLALTPTSSPFSSEDQPSMQMAIVPCFMIPASMVRSVMQVPIFSAESISRHGFR
ncbi:hypothetical protein Daus18300_008189 [Diaporthe australafricana]|uniref:Reticulocyte-binding protein 2 n=1 Tax=Diaporthe australafricana TaxID=127596 RepID=A0ABR3WJN8_9PEZI